MKKVGIVTFSNANNYGAILQSYALQRYIEMLGSCAEHINFRFKAKKSGKKQCYVGIVSKLKRKFALKKKRQGYESFRRKYLKYSEKVYFESVSDSGDIDIYIAGSDQIWNTDLNGGNKTFYLEFSDQKKYAYAASVGRQLTVRDKDMIKTYINHFDGVSARESELKEFIETNHVKCTLVCDPVFLIAGQEWHKLEKKVRVPERYIFAYAMEDTPVLRRALESAVKKFGGAKVLWLQGGNGAFDGFPGKKKTSASPSEFLYLIDNSECVVTNSFHGAAFSAIFGKPLYIAAHSSRNARLAELAGHISSSDKIIFENDDITEDKLILPSENHMKDLISVSQEFLKDILKQE